MGKQVALVLMGDDEEELFRRISDLGQFELLRAVSRSPPHPLQLPLPQATPEMDEFDACLVLRPLTIVARVPVIHIDTVGQYVVDHLDGEVIEYSRPVVVDRESRKYGKRPSIPWIVPGRLWFSATTSENEAKSPLFVDWAHRALRIARRSLHRLDDSLYAGSIAQRVIEAGGLVLERPQENVG